MITILIRALRERSPLATFGLLFQLKEKAEKSQEGSIGVGKYKNPCSEDDYFFFVHDPEEGSMYVPFHWPLDGTPTFNQGVQEAKRKLNRFDD